MSTWEGDVCPVGGWRGTLAAFFSVLEKKTENSSGALDAGLTDRKQSRNKAHRRDFYSHTAPVCLLQNSPATTGKQKSALNCGSFQRGNIHYSPVPAAESVLMAFQVTGFHPLSWNTGREVS